MAEFSQQYTNQQFPTGVRTRSGVCQQCAAIGDVAQLQIEVPGIEQSPVLVVCAECLADFVMGAPTLGSIVYIRNQAGEWQACEHRPH